MNILLVGGGGREHALAAAIVKSNKVSRLIVTPGNCGIADLAECVACTDNPAIIALALAERIDLVVIGPETPLIEGLADDCHQAGIAVFGPSKAAAQLEGSKAFARDFCTRHSLPQPEWRQFSDSAAATAYIKSTGRQSHVIKADGLAAGKGVIVADSQTQSIKAVQNMLDEHRFGTAGARILIEERLTGVEASLFALIGGRDAVLIGTAQDYKRARDGDLGANTGGMGAISPAPALSQKLTEKAWNTVILPVINGMADENTPYVGFLYAGLMIEGDEIKIIEFNCRFGDPEAEAILPRLDSDLVSAMDAAARGEKIPQVGLAENIAVTVVMVNEGYPGEYVQGAVIDGLKDKSEALVFHAGTKITDGQTTANGGRVLAVTGLGATRQEARLKAYNHASNLRWPGCYYRQDIGL